MWLLTPFGIPDPDPLIKYFASRSFFYAVNNRLKILIAETDDRIRRLMNKILVPKGLHITYVGSREELEMTFADDVFQVVVMDISTTGANGLSFVNTITKSSTPPVVIVVTANGSIEDAVEAMKNGAFDYVTKPFDETRFTVAIDRAINLKELMSENKNLRGQLNDEFNINQIVAVSQIMKVIKDH